MRRRPLGKGNRRQLSQRLHIHRPLEIDDLTHRLPEIDPSILIELRLLCPPEIELRRVPLQAQQEPPLLLAKTHWKPVPTHIFCRETITQPARGLSDQIDV